MEAQAKPRKRVARRTGINHGPSTWKTHERIPETLERTAGDLADAKGLLAAGFTDTEVRDLTGLTTDEMEAAKGHWRATPDLPGPAEIRRRAKEIRGEWSPEERAMRRVWIEPTFYLPGFGWVA